MSTPYVDPKPWTLLGLWAGANVAITAVSANRGMVNGPTLLQLALLWALFAVAVYGQAKDGSDDAN